MAGSTPPLRGRLVRASAGAAGVTGCATRRPHERPRPRGLGVARSVRASSRAPSSALPSTFAAASGDGTPASPAPQASIDRLMHTETPQSSSIRCTRSRCCSDSGARLDRHSPALGIRRRPRRSEDQGQLGGPAAILVVALPHTSAAPGFTASFASSQSRDAVNHQHLRRGRWAEQDLRRDVATWGCR